MTRAVLLALLAVTGCASRPSEPPSVTVSCPAPVAAAAKPVAAPVVIVAPVTDARKELLRATAGAATVVTRADATPEVVAEVTQRSRDAEAAVSRLERRKRYGIAKPADVRDARQAVGGLADFVKEMGAP